MYVLYQLPIMTRTRESTSRESMLTDCSSSTPPPSWHGSWSRTTPSCESSRPRHLSWELAKPRAPQELFKLTSISQLLPRRRRPGGGLGCRREEGYVLRPVALLLETSVLTPRSSPDRCREGMTMRNEAPGRIGLCKGGCRLTCAQR